MSRPSGKRPMRDRIADALPTTRLRRAAARREVEEQDREDALADRVRRERVAQRSLEYLFVVTYGRSGSTLLQGILNSTPGYLIRGENDGAVYRLFKYHQSCRVAKRQRTRRGIIDERHPWYGIDGYPERRAIQRLRWLVLDTLIRPGPDARVVGFKEIRWGQDDLDKYVAFLRRAFPGARFIFNTRSLEAVAQSRWWAERPDALETLRNLEERQLRVFESLGDAGFRVHYDDYVDDPSGLRELFAWLGAEFDQERIRSVLATPHSY